MPESEMTPSDMPPPRRSPFEWSLAALRPADSDAGRPSFMFKAGQASRERVVRFWRVLALGCLGALIGGGAMAFWTVVEAEHRAAVAEARAANSLLEGKAAIGGNRNGTADPVPVEPVSGDGQPVVSHDTPAPVPHEEPVERGFATQPPPSPQAIAAALQLRRDILTAGLGMIPDGKPGPFGVPERVEPPRAWPTPSTVFATPPAAPKKPITPIDVEDQ
jgi:hypothetical protein